MQISPDYMTNHSSITSSAHPEEISANQRQLRVGQARLLFQHSAVGLAAALAVALVETWVLWNVADRHALTLWISAMLLATLLRTAVMIGYWRSNPDETRVSKWIYSAVVGNLLSGCVWGASILLFDINWDAQYQLLVLVSLSGVTAGAISAYAAYYPAFLAIHLPAIAPVSVWFMLQNNMVYQSLGGIMMVYAIGLLIIGHTHYKALRRSLQLTLDNQQLVDKMIDTNQHLAIEIESKQEALEALSDEKERIQVTLHSIGDGVITTDPHGTVLYLNSVAEQLTGWPTDQAMGKPIEDVFRLALPENGDNLENDRRTHDRTGFHELVGSRKLLNRDGAHYYINSSSSPIRASEENLLGSVIVFHDVSEQRKMAENLSYQASHDALTGLINRREFEYYVELALHSAKNTSSVHCLCYIDLDQFKVVNDTCGHVAGDELLKRLASGLPTLLRDSDILARLGGDEFAVLLEDCNAQVALEFAERVCIYVKEHRFTWDKKVFDIGASIGIVEITAESENVGTILSAADIACYEAKDTGRNRVHIYQGADSDTGRRHSDIQLVSEITKAIDEDRLVLYFQKIVPVNKDGDHSLHGEILVRMLDESRNILPPGLFLPAAERYDLMPSLDLWIIRNTFAWWSEHYDAGSGGLIAINLSGNSVGSAKFQQEVLSLIQAHREIAGAICFEITETAAISNFESATGFIKQLRSFGVKISLDDFGSGLSSFAYLKNLPVDYLKIDGSFVRDIVDDPIDREMVKSIHQLGRVMGIQTIAEFVENGEILSHLEEIGVDFVQGYGIDKPKPLTEVFASAENTESVLATPADNTF